MKKIVLYTAGVLVLGFGFLLAIPSNNSLKTSYEDKAKSTVAVVNLYGNSGGTGVIIDSANMSVVLTNNHVCEVVRHGGYVVLDDNSRYPVVSYRQYNLHDLCLVTVATDLHITASIANRKPALYSEAIVSGHPSLLPTIITTGHFSSKILGTVLVGRKSCTNITPENAITCLLLGGIPIIKNFEMQVVYATIKPGSSGSAVYNDKGEVAGLVFAGSGDLGYAMIVPVEYIINFLRNELPGLPHKFPTALTEEDEPSDTRSMRNICKLNIVPSLIPICNLINNSIAYIE